MNLPDQLFKDMRDFISAHTRCADPCPPSLRDESGTCDKENIECDICKINETKRLVRRIFEAEKAAK